MRGDNMTFVDIQYILVVAEEGNFTRAAQKLYVSQPALSQRVQKVENELQTNLFTRTVSGLELTHAGLLFVEMARNILGIYDEFREKTIATMEDTSSQLKIGIPPNQSRITTPFLAERFSLLHPSVQLVFKNGNSAWIEDALLSEKIDVGVVHYPMFNASLSYKTLYKVRVCIYLRKGSPATNKAKKKDGYTYPVLSLSDIKEEPIGLVLPGMRSRMYVENLFLKERIVPNVVQEMSSYESLRGLADSGICTLIPPWPSNNQDTHDMARVFDIESEYQLGMDIALVFRANAPYLKTYDTLSKLLTELYTELYHS